MKNLNNIDLKAILRQITKHRVIGLSLVTLLLLGFTLWRTQALSNPQPDPAYLNAERSKASSQKITIDTALVEQIKKLTQPKVDVEPKDLGTKDPFNP